MNLVLLLHVSMYIHIRNARIYVHKDGGSITKDLNASALCCVKPFIILFLCLVSFYIYIYILYQ